MTGPVPPPVVVLTDRRLARRPLAEVVRAASDGGAGWVVLREKDLPYAARARLADELRTVLEPYGGRLVVSGPDPFGGDAVHLAAADPYPAAGVAVTGRSCHDAAELARLSTEDYVTLSPAFRTATKPGHGPALGPTGLAALGRRAPVPWLALGGVDGPDRAAACAAAGAHGVAVLGAVMRAADPAALVTAMRSAVLRSRGILPVRP